MIDVPVRVKDALRDGSLPKEYQIIVYQEDETTVDFTIGNDNLVSESVKYDERMCSDSTLKFGLCEGASIEFQAFGIPNITGRRIKVNIRVQYYSVYGLLSWETIPLGYFTVKETSRQASTGILKITAYNKLQSDYLDAKANALIAEEFDFTDTVYVHDVIALLLKEYSIIPLEQTKIPASTSEGSLGSLSTAYQYNTTIYGKQGAFTPSYILKFAANITQSTNIYFDGYVYRRLVDLSNAENKPIKIRFDVDMDMVDQNIYSAVFRELKKIANYNISDEDFIKRILNMFGADESKADVPTFFPTIYIIFRSGRTASYGYNLYTKLKDGQGTFGDLSKITLLNVKQIYINYPKYLYFGPLVSGNVPRITDTSQGDILHNRMNMDGPDQYYYYYADQAHKDADDPYYDGYLTPKLPDGSDISSNGLSDYINVYQVDGLTDFELTEISVNDLPDVTLRDLQTAVYEQSCLFGQLDRESDLFMGVSLNNKRLYPAESLYPNTALYPTSANEDGQAERANRSMYSKLWADEGNIRSFRYLIITYKGTETDESGNLQEVEKRLQRTIDKDGTDDYNMSSNWLFKNLVWTEEDVGTYADAMVSNLRNVTWFPFEMWCAGLPYIETGDEVEINMSDEAYTSYVLRRSMSGIQNLQDEIINGTLDIF